jgi:hypothetical protein
MKEDYTPKKWEKINRPDITSYDDVPGSITVCCLESEMAEKDLIHPFYWDVEVCEALGHSSLCGGDLFINNLDGLFIMCLYEGTREEIMKGNFTWFKEARE